MDSSEEPGWREGVEASIRQLERNKHTATIFYSADYVLGIERCILALQALLARGGPALTPVD